MEQVRQKEAEAAGLLDTGADQEVDDRMGRQAESLEEEHANLRLACQPCNHRSVR